MIISMLLRCGSEHDYKALRRSVFSFHITRHHVSLLIAHLFVSDVDGGVDT